jgi:hypothetical protein
VYSSLGALTPPRPLKGAHQDTRRALQRNLRRLRAYRDALDDSSTQREIKAAANRLPRTAMDEDADRLRTGLQQLGDESCDLRPPPKLKTIRLPTLSDRAERDEAASEPQADGDRERPDALPAPQPDPGEGGENPDVAPAPDAGENEPDPAPGGQNPDVAPGGGGGGGGAGGGGGGG